MFDGKPNGDTMVNYFDVSNRDSECSAVDVDTILNWIFVLWC